MRVTIEFQQPGLPRSRTRRALAAAMVIALLVPAIALASHQFADVPGSNPFHGNIGALAESGVTAGCGNGNYCPSLAVTREQMAAFLSRGLGRVTRHDANAAIPPSSSTPFDTFTIVPGLPNGAVTGVAPVTTATPQTVTIWMYRASGSGSASVYGQAVASTAMFGENGTSTLTKQTPIVVLSTGDDDGTLAK